MIVQENHPRTSEKVPPVWLVRIVTRVRTFLERINRRLVPPHVSMMELSLSFWYTQAIYVAAKLQIADHLKNGPRSIGELATASGAHAPSLYRVMRALASIEIFSEDTDGRFSLTPMANALRIDVPNSMHPIAIMTGENWWWRAWGRILHSVQTGKSSFEHVHDMPFFDFMTKFPEAAVVFDKAMTAYSVQTAVLVATTYSFPTGGMVVDVGGGQGILGATILEYYPGLRGMVFDLPATAVAAKSVIASKELSSRCQIVAGNFFEAVPEGGDIYIFKHIIHDWNDEQATKILKNCHHAMSPGGKLLLVEMVIPPGNQPFMGKFLDLGVMMMADDARERTEKEYRNLLAGAGFEVSRIIPLPSPESIIEAVRR